MVLYRATVPGTVHQQQRQQCLQRFKPGQNLAYLVALAAHQAQRMRVEPYCANTSCCMILDTLHPLGVLHIPNGIYTQMPTTSRRNKANNFHHNQPSAAPWEPVLLRTLVTSSLLNRAPVGWGARRPEAWKTGGLTPH